MPTDARTRVSRHRVGPLTKPAWRYESAGGNSEVAPLISPPSQPLSAGSMQELPPVPFLTSAGSAGARIARNQEVNMRTLPLVAVLVVSAANAQTQLTVYNQNFAAVKEVRTLELAKGENEVRVTDITAHLEPESVVLRELRQPDSHSGAELRERSAQRRPAAAQVGGEAAGL